MNMARTCRWKCDDKKEPKGPKKTTTGTHTAKNSQASGSAPVSVMNWRQKNPVEKKCNLVPIESQFLRII